MKLDYPYDYDMIGVAGLLIALSVMRKQVARKEVTNRSPIVFEECYGCMFRVTTHFKNIAHYPVCHHEKNNKCVGWGGG